MQVGMRAPEDDPNKYKLIRMAADKYFAAANHYPEDDDFHPMMLRKHMECLCLLNKPLKETLPICDRIIEVVPQSLEIWKFGSGGEVSRSLLKEMKEFAAHWRAEIKEGRATMDSVGKISMPTVPKLKTEKDNLPIKFKRRED